MRRMIAESMLAAALLLTAAVTPTTQAGVISMQVTCQVIGTNLVVNMVNKGDEPAQNVRAQVTFGGKEMHTDNVSSFPPNLPVEKRFPLDLSELKGTYPATVIVDFEDLNAYPFSSVSIQQVRTGGSSAAEIMGVFQGGMELATKVEVPLRIKNRSEKTIDVACTVVTPRELLPETPSFQRPIPPHGDEQVMVMIENFSGTPTSAYPIHVLIEYDQEGEHFCVPATTTLTIIPPPPASSKRFWLVLAVVVVVAGLVLLPQIMKAVSRGK